MSEKDYENVLKHLAPADLHQQFDKTADALEKITKMYFDMKAKNEALMEALEKNRRFSKTENFQKYSDGYKQGYEECLDELEEVAEAIQGDK